MELDSLLDGFRLMRESIPRLQESGISVGDLANVLRGAPSPSGPSFGELLHDDAIEAMAIGMLELDATVLDLVFDPTVVPVFDPRRELPVPGIVLAADPSKPDALVKPTDVERLGEHSPQIECRTVVGAGHLIHDSKDHRSVVLTAVVDLLARI